MSLQNNLVFNQPTGTTLASLSPSDQPYKLTPEAANLGIFNGVLRTENSTDTAGAVIRSPNNIYIYNTLLAADQFAEAVIGANPGFGIDYGQYGFYLRTVTNTATTNTGISVLIERSGNKTVRGGITTVNLVDGMPAPALGTVVPDVKTQLDANVGDTIRVAVAANTLTISKKLAASAVFVTLYSETDAAKYPVTNGYVGFMQYGERAGMSAITVDGTLPVAAVTPVPVTPLISAQTSTTFVATWGAGTGTATDTFEIQYRNRVDATSPIGTYSSPSIVVAGALTTIVTDSTGNGKLEQFRVRRVVGGLSSAWVESPEAYMVNSATTGGGPLPNSPPPVTTTTAAPVVLVGNATTLSGTGIAGAAISATIPSVNSNTYATQVLADGTWAIVFTSPLPVGSYTANVVQTVGTTASAVTPKAIEVTPIAGAGPLTITADSVNPGPVQTAGIYIIKARVTDAQGLPVANTPVELLYGTGNIAGNIVALTPIVNTAADGIVSIPLSINVATVNDSEAYILSIVGANPAVVTPQKQVKILSVTTTVVPVPALASLLPNAATGYGVPGNTISLDIGNGPGFGIVQLDGIWSIPFSAPLVAGQYTVALKQLNPAGASSAIVTSVQTLSSAPQPITVNKTITFAPPQAGISHTITLTQPTPVTLALGTTNALGQRQFTIRGLPGTPWSGAATGTHCGVAFNFPISGVI